VERRHTDGTAEGVVRKELLQGLRQTAAAAVSIRRKPSTRYPPGIHGRGEPLNAAAPISRPRILSGIIPPSKTTVLPFADPFPF